MDDKGINAFPTGICPKVNMIAWVEFELALYATVRHINHCTKETPPSQFSEKQLVYSTAQVNRAI